MDKTKAHACLKGVLMASLSVMFAPSLAIAGESCGEETPEAEYSDLLTGGLGSSGLENKTPPTLQDPQSPTREELRTLAIYTNYRAIVDTSVGGGYGKLYGPQVGSTAGEGGVPGYEYLKFEEEEGCQKKVTMMVQIPKSYDPENGCIVAAASPASRGIYGAIAIAEWGLKHNCAMAFTDKGTGIGVHDLRNNTVNLIDGVRGSASDPRSNFTARYSPADKEKVEGKNVYAIKHVHSQQNPEKDWGKNVLRAVEYALAKLNEKFGKEHKITKENTTIIAASLSNGGGAALRAAEEDSNGLIDGVVAWEPNITPRVEGRPFTIAQDEKGPRYALHFDHSTPMLDYATLINVYQGCATLASASEHAFPPITDAEKQAFKQRCAHLHDKGLLTSDDTDDQAREAQEKINDFGILPEQNFIQANYYGYLTPRALSVTYANAYGRFGVGKNLCGYSFGALDAQGAPVPLSSESEAQIFGVWNGVPGVASPDAIGSISPADKDGDQNLSAALCLRSLVTGHDVGVGDGPLSKEMASDSAEISKGADKILASGNLHRVPAIIVTGRNDSVIAPNFASRAYFAINNMVEPTGSNLRYYEVTNAQHLDSFNGFQPGFAERYIPLFYYFHQSMDLMHNHLGNHKPLPPSQVVHTKPRQVMAMSGEHTNALPGEQQRRVADISEDNVPKIKAEPPQTDLITFSGNTLRIPE